MKTTELKKLIKEAVKEAIQEELKDILLEAVRSSKPTITEGASVAPSVAKPDLEAQKAFRQQMLSQMSMGNGNINLATNDVSTFQPPKGMSGAGTAAEGSSLPPGNVGLDQIMGLMNNK
jgi:hypothetical protein